MAPRRPDLTAAEADLIQGLGWSLDDPVVEFAVRRIRARRLQLQDQYELKQAADLLGWRYQRLWRFLRSDRVREMAPDTVLWHSGGLYTKKHIQLHGLLVIWANGGGAHPTVFNPPPGQAPRRPLGIHSDKEFEDD